MNNNKEAEVLTISTKDLAAKVVRNDEFEFWNVLTSEYYSGENIKGSIHVPLDQIGRYVKDAAVPKNREIVVYCAGPHCPQSASAFEKLTALGYTNVRAYEGGLEEWEAAGLGLVADKTVVSAEPANAVASLSCH